MDWWREVMITNINSILAEAKSKKFAVGSFNIYNYETIRGVMETIAELKQPAIIAFGEKYLKNMDLEEVAALVKLMDRGSNVSVAIHLDHCKSVNHIVQAIRAGFTSVMIDGSNLSFEENVSLTKHVVDIAHAVDVSVEAELGSISLGAKSNEDSAEQIYTDPDQAEQFVEQTGVDCLAVSIGTVHGMYKGEPKVNVEVLKNISSKVNIPLVLHGGSGTPENIIHDCIKNGICKINVNTEISMNVVENLKFILNEKKNYHFSVVSLKEKEFVKQVVKKYINIFS